jgi:hypothetical protein
MVKPSAFGKALSRVSIMDWIKIVSLLLTVGIAWGRIEARAAAAEAHLSAIEESLQRAAIADVQWRRELMQARRSDLTTIQQQIQQLHQADDDLSRRVTEKK